MNDSFVSTNPNSLDIFPSFKNLHSTKPKQDAFTIDERDRLEQKLDNNNQQSRDEIQVKKVKTSNPSVQCDICSVSISSQIVYDIHVQGRKHQMQLKTMLLKNREYKMATYDELCSRKSSNQIVNNCNQPSNSIVNQTQELSCEICHVKCNSQQIFDAHIAGKRHQMKLRENVFPSSNPTFTYSCSICSYCCQSNKQLQQHRIQKHSNKQQINADLNKQNETSHFDEYQSSTMNFECRLCEKVFRQEKHLIHHLDSASHRAKDEQQMHQSKSINANNPFFTNDNSRIYLPQTNPWSHPTHNNRIQYETMNSYDEMTNPKRRRIDYNYTNTYDEMQSNSFGHEYPTWNNNQYYSSNSNYNPSIYYSSDQQQALPDFIPLSSHYSY